MPDSSSTVKTIPTPLHPTAGDTLQNDAPAFSWSDVDGATAYHLQVAPTDAFETLLFDSSVGNHTSLTVYDAVPQDGGTYYWRVRAETTGGPTAWSTPASFTAGESIAAKAASQATQPAPSDAPTIREPTEGAPVD